MEKENSNKQYFMIIAIVAIVAIVALVVMVNGGKRNGSVVGSDATGNAAYTGVSVSTTSNTYPILKAKECETPSDCGTYTYNCNGVTKTCDKCCIGGTCFPCVSNCCPDEKVAIS